VKLFLKSDQELIPYLCRFCRLRDFAIKTFDEIKPLEQLKHFRQHLNYYPFKCIIDENCGQKFNFFPLFVEHIKCDHNMSEDMIKNSTNSLYSYEKIIEIEKILELKGIKCELIGFDFENDGNKTIGIYKVMHLLIRISLMFY
jgi:hypothetical protein